MQDNTLYCSKVLSCINMISEDNVKTGNKKVSKEAKRCRYVIELPNTEFKNELRVLATKKGITVKKLEEKIHLNYAIQERIRQRDRSVQGLKDTRRGDKKYSSTNLSNEEQEKIKKLLFKAYKLAKDHSDTEFLYFKNYIEDYIEDYNFRGCDDDLKLSDFDDLQ